jgi:hypothetical protein
MSIEDGPKIKPEAPSDSDDDKPLSSLIQKRKALQQANGSSDSAAKKVKTEPSESTTKKVKTEPNSKSKVKEEKGQDKEKEAKPKSSSSSSASRKSAEFYETQKGEMVQKLLCRWWYAIQWPKLEDIQKPEGYESLDGFPGVYISTRVSITIFVATACECNWSFVICCLERLLGEYC